MPANQEKRVLRIGSRDSDLALYQSRLVKSELERAFPDRVFEIVTMSTIGDRMLDLSLSEIGEKSLFTKELEAALEAKEVDLLVHSLKDVPTTLPTGMVLGAILQREDPRDAVILKKGLGMTSLADLPVGGKVGTSAPRRVSQLRRLYPDLDFVSIRGNLNRRFNALETGEVNAIILAVAGLKRLGLADKISCILEPSDCMYAVGQGAVSVECRDSDFETLDIISTLTHPETALRVIAERSFMKTFGGGCNIPVAAWSEVKGQSLTLKGGVFAMNGDPRVLQTVNVELPSFEAKLEESEFRKPPESYAGIAISQLSKSCLESAEKLGKLLSEKMLSQGAMDIVNQAKKEFQAGDS